MGRHFRAQRRKLRWACGRFAAGYIAAASRTHEPSFLGTLSAILRSLCAQQRCRGTCGQTSPSAARNPLDPSVMTSRSRRPSRPHRNRPCKKAVQLASLSPAPTGRRSDRAGLIEHPLDIRDAWKNSYSENTSQKVWAAKFTARHPNLVALELSSFKCGHDAPIYTVVEETVTKSGTPYFSFKDIDENKPTGSIKIRVETISYFLKRYREEIVRQKEKERSVEAKLKEFEAKLRAELDSLPPGAPPPPYPVESPVAINTIRQEE